VSEVSSLLPTQPTITNALTIDVEDYFQVSAFAESIERSQWDSLECRVERNVNRMLDLLAEKEARATFFTLGWIAERYPALVRRIVADDHELASHGYGHQRASDLSEPEFREDVQKAKAILEDIGGVHIRGYRAPSFSIGQGNLWALDVLQATGHAYSSSIYPVKHDHYGSPDAPRFAHPIREGLMEIPPTTLRLMERNLPSGGGGYFRLLPYGVSRWLLQQVNKRDLQPAIFYCHPWEIDADQPRVAGVGWKSRFRHYVNLGKTEQRLARLLDDFRWDRMDRVFLDRSPSSARTRSHIPAPQGVPVV
jgi:polysaccharide deacetylase family protein (PEP-CTERM system associated)